jgi:hypothetical protein
VAFLCAAITVEIEGESTPALIAEQLGLFIVGT